MSWLDALIDAIVPLVLEHPLAGETALAHLPPTRRAGSKPFYIEGLDTQTGLWEPLALGMRYSELQGRRATGQPQRAAERDRVQRVRAEGRSLRRGRARACRRARHARRRGTRARARSMAGPLDAQLSIGLRSSSVAWSASYVQQIAARAGFVPGVLPGAGCCRRPAEGRAAAAGAVVRPAGRARRRPAAGGGARMHAVAGRAPTPESAEPFPALHRMATQLADDLDATAVDDLGEPITLHAFQAIGEELERLYRGLEALDLAAGTPAARLFD
ncbi:MAG: cell division protein FtsZ [Rubrivivax sp.]